MTEAEVLEKQKKRKTGYPAGPHELAEMVDTLVPVILALREENASLRKSLGEAQHLLASRHFPRPLI